MCVRVRTILEWLDFWCEFYLDIFTFYSCLESCNLSLSQILETLVVVNNRVKQSREITADVLVSQCPPSIFVHQA